jgi:hypothetical protein
MAKKRKAARNKTAGKKSGRATLSAKAKKKIATKSKARRAGNRKATRAIEPSSGSASSSLDPKRAGRLRLSDTGQSERNRRIGDLQGISMRDQADSESVGELLEEGQTLEAEFVQSIENVPDADQGEVRTHEVPEADVPQEYLDQDKLDQQ